jgi:hypothetical protein
VRARVKTGVLVRKPTDAFRISGKTRARRRALAQASKAREGYYEARAPRTPTQAVTLALSP